MSRSTVKRFCLVEVPSPPVQKILSTGAEAEEEGLQFSFSFGFGTYETKTKNNKVLHTHTHTHTQLHRPFSLKDLESLELAFYNSLIWIQENDPEPLDLTFTVEEEAFGQLTTHELKPGGMDIPVTDENKDDYIDLMIRWRLDRGVAEQMENLKKGFSEVCIPECQLVNRLQTCAYI